MLREPLLLLLEEELVLREPLEELELEVLRDPLLLELLPPRDPLELPLKEPPPPGRASPADDDSSATPSTATAPAVESARRRGVIP